jgi:hypothetical protein
VPRARSWTDEQLTAAVAESRTLSEVCKRLGILPGKYDVLRRHIARLGLDASHLPRAGAGSPRTSRRYTDEDLIEAVRVEGTVHGVLRRLGYNPNGVYRSVVAQIRKLDLDIAHFVGRSWARGRSRPSWRVKPLSELLVKGSTTRSGHIRRRLIAAGLKPAHCERCGLSEWQGRSSHYTSITSMGTTRTTGSRTYVFCARTATPSPIPGVGVRGGRRTPTWQRGNA